MWSGKGSSLRDGTSSTGISSTERSLLLLLFEVQDVLRGGLVANISIGINLLRENDLFLNIIGKNQV